MPHVLVAAPDQLHRKAGLAGDQRRLDAIVCLQAPAEAAAELSGVEFDRRLAEPQRLGDITAHPRLHLGGRPDFRLAVRHPDGGVHRLERGVGEQGDLVGRLEPAGGAGQGRRVVRQRGFGVRLGWIKRGLPAGLGEGVEPGGDVRRRHTGRPPRRPFRVKRRKAHSGGPVAISDDRHRVRQLHHPGDAGHLQRRTLVDSASLPPKLGHWARVATFISGTSTSRP